MHPIEKLTTFTELFTPSKLSAPPSAPAEVHAGVISRGGRELLEKADLKLFYGEETEHIKTVDGRIYCPFEAMVQDIDDPTQAYYAVVEKMNSFRKPAKCD